MSEDRAFSWEDEAERVLAAFIEMVPQTVRPLAEASARDESELGAQERGAASVEAADVVRGWIRITPPEQRNVLVEVIDDLGFDPETFADDLQSVDEPPEEG